MNYFNLQRQVLFYVCMCMAALMFPTNFHGQSSTCDSLYPISRVTLTYLEKGSKWWEYKWGYIDCKGKVIVDPEFEKVFDFSEGLGILVNQQDSVLIDVNGNKKIIPGTRILTRYSEGVAIAAKQGNYFIIDKTGKVVAKLPEEIKEEEPYFFASHFSNGLAPINTINGIGFIDKTGKFVIAPTFYNAKSFLDGVAVVILDEKWALIDTSGKFIIPPIDDPISGPSDGLILVQGEKDEWKYFNKNGEVVLEVKYDYAGDFVEGFARVKAEKKWGFIDKKGNLVFPLKFDDVKDFSEGLAAVEVKLKWGFVDKSGKFIIPPTFEYVQSSFKNGLAYVRKDGLEGYIDKNGKWIWKRKT